MSTSFGYTPEYVMPIIPPPASGDPSTYYSGLTYTVTAVNNGIDGITYTVTNSTPPVPVYAMVGGIVTFFPTGAVMPDGGVSGGQGSIVIQTGLLDQQDLTKKLPLGVPPMTYAIYVNIEPNSAKTALIPLVALVDVRVLNKSWSETEASDPATETLAVKQAKYIDRVMLGEKFVPVNGGYQVGEAGVNGASDPEFTLKFVDGTGQTNISPILYIRNMPLFDPKWTDHPLITSISTFVSPLDIYVKFEVWNPSSVALPTSSAYLGVDAGIEIKLMEYDPVSGDDELASGLTNSNGVVHFGLPALPSDSGGGNPDLYFKIISPVCSAVTEFTLPAEWSTADTGLASVSFWNAADGSPGYFPDFGGQQLGNAAHPLTYRIGMDYHLRLKYSFDAVNTKMAPEKIQVDLVSDGVFSEDIIKTDYTDKNGEIHGITFDAEPESDLFFRVYFKLEDPAVNLKETRILFDRNDDGDETKTWDTNEEDENIKIEFLENRSPSLYDTAGSVSNKPLELVFTKENRNHALYFLVVVREIHEFLFYFTNGQWQGRKMTLDFYHLFLAPSPTSFPNENIWFTSNSAWWTRETIVHEYSHQIMWQEAGYTDAGIAGQFGWDGISDFDFIHYFNGETTAQRTLTEGWAEAMALIFTLSDNINFNTLHGGATVLDPNPADVSTFDKGYYVEGAFASAIYSMFWNYVVGSLSPAGSIIESDNGDIIAKNPFMSPANQSDLSSRFLSMIWQPLQELDTQLTFVNKSASKFVEYVQQFNSGTTAPNLWYKLRSEFLMWNMASFGYTDNPNSLLPSITSIVPNMGPDTGGNAIGITGTNYFVKKDIPGYREVKLKISIGPNVVPDSDVTIISETDIYLIVPAGTPGVVDVKIETIVRGKSVGNFVLFNSYTYV